MSGGAEFRRIRIDGLLGKVTRTHITPTYMRGWR